MIREKKHQSINLSQNWSAFKTLYYFRACWIMADILWASTFWLQQLIFSSNRICTRGLVSHLINLISHLIILCHSIWIEGWKFKWPHPNQGDTESFYLGVQLILNIECGRNGCCNITIWNWKGNIKIFACRHIQ